jgi:hypothetical protein
VANLLLRALRSVLFHEHMGGKTPKEMVSAVNASGEEKHFQRITIYIKKHLIFRSLLLINLFSVVS